jgi:hypothetical protein
MKVDTEPCDVGAAKSRTRPGGSVLRWLLVIHIICAAASVWPEAYRKWQFFLTRDLYPAHEGVAVLGGLPVLILVPMELIYARSIGLRGWEFARLVVAVFGLAFVQFSALLPTVQ